MLAVVAAAVLIPPPPRDPAPGISRELAQARALTLTNVHYVLDFVLEPGADRVRGHAVARFELRADAPPGDVVLDFDGLSLTGVRVNGTAADEVRRVHGHVVFPRAHFARGENEIEADFASAVAATGTPLTRYDDRASGREYLYTLLVPADAHRLFPCFDQPDLKATFELRVVAPTGWQVVGNGDVASRRARADGTTAWEFMPSERISTYLFAFAAGAWDVIESPFPLRAGADPERPMRLYLRPEEKARADAGALFHMHARAVTALAARFAHPYPFGKLDFVLVPGFPYGGMEHPGAIFYRDTALSFDHVPTVGELVNRSTLVYHEVSHQWFGNLVSFVWFDDLWLKEGFATFTAYQTLEELEPERRAWVAFHRRVKPRAYEIDATPGTTPIYQALANLADAKSAYGAIVYNKAPAVLRELQARLGDARFRAGVSTFLRRFAWGNATWKDLVAAFEQASATSLAPWSNAWILTPSLPRVRAQWSVAADGTLASFVVRQESAGGGAARWPLHVTVLCARGGERTQARAVLDGDEAVVAALVGRPAPDWVLLNPGDEAYALFLLDARSAGALLQALPREPDALSRQVALSALRETMRAGELDPLPFGSLLLQLLADEKEPEAHLWLLDALAQVALRYLEPDRAAELRARAEALLCAQFDAGQPATALQVFRTLVRMARSDEALARVRDAVTRRKLPRDVALGPQDTYLGFAALLAAGRGDDLRANLPRPDDVAKWVYLAEAAGPTAATKQRYFETYLDAKEPPEQWVQLSLAFFHWPGQEALTLPFLRRALDRVDWVKQHRKIFFMPAWIDGFVNGHTSADALAEVETFLRERKDLQVDIQRKVLQSLDELRRVVAIRARWK